MLPHGLDTDPTLTGSCGAENIKSLEVVMYYAVTYTLWIGAEPLISEERELSATNIAEAISEASTLFPDSIVLPWDQESCLFGHDMPPVFVVDNYDRSFWRNF